VCLIAGDAQTAVLLCAAVDENTIATLAAWPAERLAVYSPRPATVRNQLEQRGLSVNSYSLLDALLRGQTTLRSQ
jgi:hypothetical protein